MTSGTLNLGCIRILFFRLKGEAYGNDLKAVLWAFATAKEERAAVFFVAPPESWNRTIFHLRCDGVRNLTDTYWAPLLSALWRAAETVDSCRAKVADVWNAMRRAMAVFQRNAAAGAEPAPTSRVKGKAYAPFYCQVLAEDRVRLSMPAALEAEAIAAARGVGLDPGRSIVTVHVRESGYRRPKQVEERSKDTVRNADIRTYLKAIRRLVALGYQVVRLGDPDMTPVSEPGVLDLANHPGRTGLLDTWTILRSSLFIGCDSGPTLAGWVMNAPCLTVNVTNLVNCYPPRARDRYMPKHLIEVGTGRELSLSERLRLLWDKKKIPLRYVDNSPDEIDAAVVEMLDVIAGGSAETPAQRAYRVLFDRELAATQIKEGYERDPEAPFSMGEGRIVGFFAERYLYPSRQAIA